MSHAHKTSTHHPAGTTLRAGKGKTHHTLKSRPPASATTKQTHTRHKPYGHSVGSLLKKEHRKTTTPAGRKKHHRGITAAQLHFIQKWDAMYQDGTLAQQVLGGGASKRKKAPTPQGNPAASAGKPAGSGHTHRKGAGSTSIHHTSHPHTTAAASHPGHDSRNYTPAPPHALQPEPHATPGHPHRR